MVRLLPFESADGPHNMAADEVLLAAAQNGVASLRLYTWTEATISLGYFQPHASSLASLPKLPWVRRPSGGETLVHHHELTYAVAVPPHLAKAPWLPRMHQIIAQALGTAARVATAERRLGEVLCFLHHTPGDLVHGDVKVVGSAQRRQRQSLLQHGGILLARSEHTPRLPGLRELTGKSYDPEQVGMAILCEFEKVTGMALAPSHWNPQEMSDIASLAEEKYSSPAWNEKR